ncbi:MAG: M56 family metallopeptidase, partial [Planctomycetota bacterium]
MITLEQVCVRPETAAYLLNLAIAVSLASGVGLAATFLCRRCSAPLRHGILLSSLSLALISPVLVGLAAQARLGMIAVAVWGPQGLDQPKQPEPARVAPSIRPEIDPMATSPSPVTSIGESSFDGGPADPAKDPFQGPAVSEEATSERTTDRAMPQAGRISSTPSWWEIAGTLWLCVWTLGVVVRAAALGRGWLSVVRLRRSFEQSHDRGLQRTVLAAARNLGLRQAPPVFTSPSVTVPLSLGLLRPVLVMPKGIERETADEALQALLLHELAHIARGDRWVGLAQRIAAVLYRWNPLIHCVNDCLSELREEICDSYVLRVQGNGRCLARLLVVMASRARPGAQIPCSLGVLQPRRDGLRGRVTRLLDRETNTMTRMNLSSIAIVVAFGTALAGVLLATGVRAEQRSGRPAPEPRVAEATTTSDPGDDEHSGSGTPPAPDASVSLLHDRDEYFLGENMLIHYRLENVGQELLPYGKGGFYPALRRNDGYTISAVPVDPAGKQIGPPVE